MPGKHMFHTPSHQVQNYNMKQNADIISYLDIVLAVEREWAVESS